MNFTTPLFYMFAIFMVLFYFGIRKHKWVVLLVFSIFFYCTWGIGKIPFLLLSTWIAWTAGSLINKKYIDCENKCKFACEEDKKEIKVITKKICRRILFISIILLLVLLLYVKIGSLIAKSFDGEISIIIPLGISYYTFSLIGYLADCYWKKDKAETNYFKLLLFTSYFPKVIQGPISKHRYLAPQLLEPHKYEYHNLCYGIQLMLWGYFKKMVIADRLSVFINVVFTDYHHKSGSILFLAAIFGAFQLYCDFSGCMDIACGFSEILGIKLEKNFNHPFFSESASEFWRRWHITLGTWFKDYVYMPLSVAPLMIKLMQHTKKRFGMHFAKNINTIISLSIVWILTGLWHGTGLSFVVWGLYWGILIIFSVLFESLSSRLISILHINSDSNECHLFRRIRTFFLFVIGRIITIPSDLLASLEIFKRIIFRFNPWELVDGTVFKMGLNEPNFIAVIIFLLIIYWVSAYEEKGYSGRDWIAEKQIVARWIMYYGLIIVIIIFGMYGPGYNASDFVYMKY
ncbi:MBOAT family O-acyltransferase [Butyrivibrio sp. AE3003]|uniref:MBOAT family O-acyltransferase n=1 Tax=Butyrivibrio sp. AE3003 TaxID=1496721 RepID=UPI000478A9F8|nr:MBOAT family O-acyltransferase [Butyrivibrio sp. AE3003]